VPNDKVETNREAKKKDIQKDSETNPDSPGHLKQMSNHFEKKNNRTVYKPCRQRRRNQQTSCIEFGEPGQSGPGLLCYLLMHESFCHPLPREFDRIVKTLLENLSLFVRPSLTSICLSDRQTGFLRHRSFIDARVIIREFEFKKRKYRSAKQYFFQVSAVKTTE
jgi:hypothetical protein